LRAGGVPLSGVRVTASSSSGQRTIVSGADGSFDFKVGLGDVQIAVEAVSGKTLPSPDPYIITGLTAGQAVTHTFVYGIDGSFTGRAVDDAGQALSSITISDYQAPSGVFGDTFT